MVDGVLVILEELRGALEDIPRLRLDVDVEPELLVTSTPRVLAGDALETGDQVERRP